MSNQANQTNRLNSISSTASTSTASTAVSPGNADGDILKQYIAELFNHYDTEHKGELNMSQLNSFFNDLLKSVGLNITFTPHQLYQVIYFSNNDFAGTATPNDVYKVFKFMLDSNKNQSKESGTDQQQPSIQPMMATQFQYPTATMQGQYISPIYNPYLQMQMQYQAQNQQPQNASVQFNGQNWVYGSYMGINPYTYRQ